MHMHPTDLNLAYSAAIPEHAQVVNSALIVWYTPAHYFVGRRMVLLRTFQLSRATRKFVEHADKLL